MRKFLSVKFILLTLLFLAATFILYKLSPRKLKPKLEPLAEISFKTKLNNLNYLESCKGWVGENIMLRRFMEEDWIMLGPHTKYKAKEFRGFPRIDYVHLDACFGEHDKPRTFVGRIRDRGDGMYGWHVVFSKLGSADVNFKEHQRFKVWIERDFPIKITEDAVPIVDTHERHYFHGLSDAIADEFYTGYSPSNLSLD